MWVLTNIPLSSGNLKSFNYGLYTFYFSDPNPKSNYKSSQWFCEGHFRLNAGLIEGTGPQNTLENLENLFQKYNGEFINKISGNFIIIKFNKDHFSIYSDRFGIRKFFYFQRGKSFIISDSLQFVKSVCKERPSDMNIVLYSLMYHFVGGRTLFNNIFHNKPAEVIEYSGYNLVYSNYWEPETLLGLQKKNISIKSIANLMSEIIQYYLSNIDINRLSLSLTGGADTRNLLSVFLANGLSPHIYTYGNIKSADCQKAISITRGLELSHKIHEINMNETVFEEYARKIVHMMGGLTSIHRVHRLLAVECEKYYADFMFLGTLGGEFIKGVSEDDYIVPSIVFDNWYNEFLSSEMLKKYFSRKFLRYSDEMVSRTINFLNEEPYFQGSAVERKFNSLAYITAHLHDAQDINLYSTVMQEVFTPFLDNDYLEMIFSSDYPFTKKESMNNKYFRRVENPVFAARFLNETFKPLIKYKYSGEHRPSEVLTNKYLAAIIKIIRQKLHSNYLPNFSLDGWMVDFVKTNLPLCNDYNILKETFNLDMLVNSLERGKHVPKESYWITYTNPIMARFIIEELNS